jgi:hypothetical protein
MMPQVHSVTALSTFALFISTGCDDVDWPEPQYVDSLRVLGVRADPPTLTPGASTELSIHCVDGSQGTDAEPACDVEVAWFARCNNPADNDPDNCIGGYTNWVEKFPLPIAETPIEDYPDGFGFGPTFNFTAPDDVLRDEFDAAGNIVRYGTSYVFFAVCAGQLVSVRNTSNRLPVECRDRVTGKTLDQRRFVVGVTTLYSYDLVHNRNPVLLTPRFDDVEIPDSCNDASECPSGFDCSTENHCLPVLQTCAEEDSDDCNEHCLSFGLSLDSFRLFSIDGTRLETPRKSVWLSYFTNAGNLPDDETSFALHAPTDATRVSRTQCIRWQPPSTPTEQAHLWAVVRDNRGGFATWDQRILVR